MQDTQEIMDDIEEVNPWTDIWVRPTKTIDWIVENHSGLLTTLFLIYLGGVYFGIGQAELKNIGDRKEVGDILQSALLTSGLGGLVTYNMWVWAIDFCAGWFGGKGNFKKTQIAFAWSMLPSVASIVLAAIGLILFEDELFKTDTPTINSSDFLYISLWTYAIIEIVLGVWHIFLLVTTVAQVQRLTIIKSILSIGIGFILMLLPFIGIMFLMRWS